jgi:Glycosyl hydrolase catalytic core
MTLGTNIDPTYPEAAPSPLQLRDLGLRWVRLVSRDIPSIHAYVDDCNKFDIAVLACVAKESDGYIMPGAQVHQIGNEGDVNSPSSWTRTPQEYHDDWDIYWGTWFAPGKPYEGSVVIAAGLASGLTNWLSQVWKIGPLQGCSGIAVHPYTKTPVQARDLINSYKSIVGYNIPIWVTESNNKKEEIQYFNSLMQNANVVVNFWYPWTRIQNNTLVGLREDDNIRRIFCA